MKANSRSLRPAAGTGGAASGRRSFNRITDSEVVLSAAPIASESRDPLLDDPQQHHGVMSSSCGDSEGHAGEKACPSYFACSGCVEVLHELSNVMTGVLTNAQVLGWKLPPYSHLKRSVREVERNAQRGGELLKRLVNRCAEKASVREVQP